MKLLLENWRQYLKEEVGLDPAHTTAIESIGLIINKKLGKGKFGTVYEVENKETGQRFAAKVVSNLGGSGYHEEEKNYNWIMKNRDKLPDEIKQHLVEVYEITKTEDKLYLVILMEQLATAPKSVLGQIFAHGSGMGYSEEKEERIFKDPEAIYEIINDVLKANNMLRDMRNFRGLSNTDRTKAANNILGAFLSDQEVPESSIKHVYTMLTTYDVSTPRWKRLFNAILNEVEKLLQPHPKAGHRAILWAAATSIEESLQHNMNKHIIPVKYGAGSYDPQRGAPPATTAVFPETEGILNTIEHFAKMGWRAKDLHTGNIMMRADTNQLVITDVGLFVVER